MRISPNDILPNGTKVQVNTKRGVVIDCKTERATPSGFISVHCIRFTHCYAKRMNKACYDEIKPTEKWVNYSFIETL